MKADRPTKPAKRGDLVLVKSEHSYTRTTGERVSYDCFNILEVTKVDRLGWVREARNLHDSIKKFERADERFCFWSASADELSASAATIVGEVGKLVTSVDTIEDAYKLLVPYWRGARAAA
jgi:hypothetical protein